MRVRLIFVEGIPGSGKSTTAQSVASWLVSRGESARAYHEMADDNPIRTRGTDAMRARHPSVRPMPDVGADGFARDPRVYALEQWDRLAQGAEPLESTVILESRYIQNSVQPAYMAGAPIESVLERFEGISARVSPAAPLLVYLRPTKIEESIRLTLQSRGDPWRGWLARSFSSLPWSKSRGLSGESAIVAFYEDWEELVERLFERHRGPKLIVEDPQRDWEAALRSIQAAIRHDSRLAG